MVTAWPTAGPRYTLPAAPFRAADVLPKRSEDPIKMSDVASCPIARPQAKA